ncbi:hypothetical protein [Shewanella sp. GXUN23E]|uniref:hypothetical protein n=1 Tax=Shewanella sp. GXUN23E TaxID=3422498 RepID=UPI003D7C81B4
MKSWLKNTFATEYDRQLAADCIGVLVLALIISLVVATFLLPRPEIPGQIAMLLGSLLALICVFATGMICLLEVGRRL